MAWLSTFELLLKPQLPRAITRARPELAPLARTVVQGYFLTIANLTNELIDLSLVVTTRTPGLEAESVLSFWDTTGVNGPASITFENVESNSVFDARKEVKRTRFDLPLNSNDTGLFLLQPNATNDDLVRAADFELRGYAEIALSSRSTQKTVQILVTAEHRGTFFRFPDQAQGGADLELGELAYALPLASGGALLELNRG